MKISTRLLLLFLVVGVLPLALFSYFNLRQDEASLRDEALSRMSGLADKKVIQVRNYLAERVQDMRMLARSTRVMDEMVIMPREYPRRQLATAQYAREDALTRHYFDRYVEDEGVFYDVFLITPQGEIVYTQKHETDFATNLLTGIYRDSQLAQAFRTASMTLEPVISGYEFYAPSQAPALFIAAPVMVDGKFKGVFAVQLGNELFYKVATDATGLGLSGEAAFTQRDGDEVLFTTPLKYQTDAALKLRVNRHMNKALAMFLAVDGESGEGETLDYRDTRVVAAWRYLPELDWGMVVKMDADEVFAPIYQQEVVMLEGLLGLLLFAGLAAYYFGRQISAPLNALAQTTNEVAAGDLGQRADESAPGELGLFAHAFNHMASNMQALYRTLEQRIEERTLELNVSNAQLQKEISERKQTMMKLQESEESSRLVLEHALDAVIMMDAEGMVTEWNDEAARIFGYQRDEVIGKVLADLIIPPPQRDAHQQGMQRLLATNDSRIIGKRIQVNAIRRDGREFPVELSIGQIYRGERVLFSAFLRDITAQKLAEDSLRVAAVAFETQEGIMITDAQANILRVNQAFQEITGFSAEEVLGKNPRILSSGRQSKEFYAEMWRQLLKEGIWSGEIIDRRKNGEIYPKWLTISAVKDKAGNISAYVAIFSDITARKRAEDEIRNLVFFDALTGLPNRRLLLDRFRLALLLSARSNHCGALLFLDMDKFKTLNDTQGHAYGDMLLTEVAHRLKACVRDVDTVARLGGDEFMVLIEEVSENMQEASQRVALVAEKIRVALAEPYVLKGYEFHSSVSIGVSMYRGSAESVDALMKYADMAMYQAKDAGRNAVRFFDPLMQQALVARAELEADLRGALVSRQLQLHYQIQVDGAHRTLGAEALLRWTHPVRGMVSPAKFIPIAEESSLILEIGHWVIETACRQLVEWAQDEQMCHLQLAINVSAQQFRQHDFVAQMKEAIVRHGIDPDRLKLELTESVVLEDVADVVSKMHGLKALGLRLSLDDFGTGYSSLSYLKQLPLDQIKIDQSFVRDITTDPNDAVMVKAIIDMAQNFRLNVIAEGVETEAQLAFLKRNGCMAYQGYLFSKPVPVAEFETLARSLYA